MEVHVRVDLCMDACFAATPVVASQAARSAVIVACFHIVHSHVCTWFSPFWFHRMSPAGKQETPLCVLRSNPPSRLRLILQWDGALRGARRSYRSGLSARLSDSPLARTVSFQLPLTTYFLFCGYRKGSGAFSHGDYTTLPHQNTLVFEKRV